MEKNYKVYPKPESFGQRVWRKTKEKAEDARYWYYQHREEVVILVPAVIGGAATIVKVVGKRVNLHKEESIRNLYCYDRSLGHYWRLRRGLSNQEWLAIDRRKANGERLSDILSELRVLK